MQVQQMIRASADILTITTLSPGNVYKRIEQPGAYAGGEPVLRFGVVQSVMNNGEDSAVTALEFTADYSGVAAALKVFDGGKPVAIFPATPDEITQHLADLTERAERDLKSAEDTLQSKRDALARVVRLRGQVGELSAPATADQLPPAAPEGVVLSGESAALVDVDPVTGVDTRSE